MAAGPYHKYLLRYREVCLKTRLRKTVRKDFIIFNNGYVCNSVDKVVVFFNFHNKLFYVKPLAR